MKLILTVLRCPDRVAPEIKHIEGGEFVLGRASGADWVLAEPGDRPQLSRRHCSLAYADNAWTLTDISTNGTMLNGERAPQGVPTRPLRAGDRLRLGEYEIEIGFSPASGGSVPIGEQFVSAFQQGSAGDSPFGAGSFAVGGFGSAFERPVSPEEALPPSVRLPDGFGAEPFGAAPGRPPAQPDHTPAYDDVIRPPNARMMLPAEWNTTPEPAHVLRMASEPMPAMVEPQRPALAPDTLLTAFLEGAGMTSGSRPADAAAAMREAGAAFRAFVQGLRRAMMARAEVKSAFRIEQTMVRSRRNNPLKFAAGDDDALAALFGSGRHTDMTAAQAVEGALADIRLHELATMAAMQEAVQEMIGKLDPAKFLTAAGGGMLPATRRARAFDLYEAEFLKLREAYSEKFDDAFGKAFALAYERVVKDLRVQDPDARGSRGKEPFA